MTSPAATAVSDVFAVAVPLRGLGSVKVSEGLAAVGLVLGVLAMSVLGLVAVARSVRDVIVPVEVLGVAVPYLVVCTLTSSGIRACAGGAP